MIVLLPGHRKPNPEKLPPADETEEQKSERLARERELEMAFLSCSLCCILFDFAPRLRSLRGLLSSATLILPDLQIDRRRGCRGDQKGARDGG